jgi:hypothetical protein
MDSISTHRHLMPDKSASVVHCKPFSDVLGDIIVLT